MAGSSIQRSDRSPRPEVFRAIVVGSAGIALATAAAAVLEAVVGVADASPVYLVAVVVAAALFGTWAAAATSVAAFVVYDFLFTTPRFTLTVANAGEWLSLLLFLFTAVVIGRLTAIVRDRAEEAERRSRESVSLVGISREIAMATAFEEAAVSVADRLRTDAEMAGVRVTLRDADGSEATVAEVGEVPAAIAREPWTLLRDAATGTSDWVRILSGDAEPPDAEAGGSDEYVVPIEADGRSVGAIHAFRDDGEPRPGRGARRILTLAADQLGIAALRDHLREELTTAEVARRSDALRGAILDSVSHDLRTPIATIRALAGTLADPGVELSPTDRRRTATAIDGEGHRLALLVRGLLDMSRIQAGAVRPDIEPYELVELLETTVGRVEAEWERRIEVEVGVDLPPVLLDAVLFDVALGNVLDNAARHAGPRASVIVSARYERQGRSVVLDVDDSGPGVPGTALPHLFDRFYRVAGEAEPARHGLGIGLAIARGFAEAMDVGIDASRSPFGGLRVRFRLPAAVDTALPEALRSADSRA